MNQSLGRFYCIGFFYSCVNLLSNNVFQNWWEVDLPSESTPQWYFLFFILPGYFPLFRFIFSLIGIPSWEKLCLGNSPHGGHYLVLQLQLLIDVMNIKLLFTRYTMIYHQHLTFPFSELFKMAMSKLLIWPKLFGTSVMFGPSIMATHFYSKGQWFEIFLVEKQLAYSILFRNHSIFPILQKEGRTMLWVITVVDFIPFLFCLWITRKVIYVTSTVCLFWGFVLPRNLKSNQANKTLSPKITRRKDERHHWKTAPLSP